MDKTDAETDGFIKKKLEKLQRNCHTVIQETGIDVAPLRFQESTGGKNKK